MAAPFHFEHSTAFTPDTAAEVLRSIPTLPGVFALHGPPAPTPSEPYLTRAADLRRRITRLLAPPDSQSKRLNLRTRVARIDYTVTGSEFESHLTLYHATARTFGLDQARRRLKLRTPFFLRFTADNAYPRVYSTNRLSKRALDNFYGPFPSRAAADRYCDAVLDLFKLRRCVEDLAPYPEHPGCVYQEMKKCLAPCNQACTPEGAAAYSAEAVAVKRFFDTRGDSLIDEIGLAREEASNGLHFERAAELHAQWHKVKAAQSLADPIVQPIPHLRALILQKAVPASKPGAPYLDSEMWVDATSPPPGATASGPTTTALSDPCSLPPVPCSAVFLLHAGCLTGPAHLSTLGVRAVKEQTSVGSSLFAQPLMLQAIPLDESPQNPVILSKGVVDTESKDLPPQNSVILSEGVVDTESKDLRFIPTPEAVISTEVERPPHLSVPSPTPTLNPEARATALIASLESQAQAPTDLATLSDHLSLLRRWYYRPEKQRAGEIFFPNVNHQWPIRRILNGAARIALGDPTPLAETHRELVTPNPAAEPAKPTRTKTLHPNRPDVSRTVPILDKPPKFKSRRIRG